MKKLLMPSGDKAHITLEHELAFPESKDFLSKTSPVSLADITKLSEERLPFMNSSPEFEKDRLALKAKESFVL
jgi:hypothetical protein